MCLLSISIWVQIPKVLTYLFYYQIMLSDRGTYLYVLLSSLSEGHTAEKGLLTVSEREARECHSRCFTYKYIIHQYIYYSTIAFIAQRQSEILLIFWLNVRVILEAISELIKWYNIMLRPLICKFNSYIHLYGLKSRGLTSLLGREAVMFES